MKYCKKCHNISESELSHREINPFGGVRSNRRAEFIKDWYPLAQVYEKVDDPAEDIVLFIEARKQSADESAELLAQFDCDDHGYETRQKNGQNRDYPAADLIRYLRPFRKDFRRRAQER